MATLTAIFQAQDNLSKAMLNAANTSSKASNAMQKLGKIGGKALKGTGVAIAAASAALLGFGKKAVSVGMEYETAMSKVMATMGMNTATAEGQAAYDTLTAAAEKMGAETAFSASQAADALNYLALAGYNADQAAAALPTVLHLAGAGAMNLAAASDLVTDAMAALQMEVNQTNLNKFADQLAKTASTTNTSVAQLGDAILTVGATAANLANGTTELNTQLGILANVGIKGAEAGTHLRNILLRLQNPTQKAAQALDKLGVSVYDSNGNMRDTGAIFNDLKTAMAGMNQQEIDQIMSTIFNKTDLAAAQALLAGAGDEYARIFSIIENSGGAAAEMYMTMLDNLKGDVDMFKSATEALYLSLYTSINGTLRELVQIGTEYMNRLNEAFKAGGFTGLANELGNVLGDAVGVIMSYAPKLVDAGTDIVIAFVESIGNNADIISRALVDIALALGNAVIKIAPKLAEAFVKIVAAAGKALTRAIPKIFNAIPEKFYNALGLDKAQVMSKVTNFANYFRDVIRKVFSGNFMGAVDSLGKALGLDEGQISKIKNAVTQLASAFERIKSAALAVAKAIAQFIGKFANIGGIEATIAGLVSGFAAFKAINAGKSIMDFAKGIKKAGGLMKLLSANKFTLIAAAIGAVVAAGVLLYKNWDKIKEKAGPVWDAIKGFAVGAWDKIKGVWNKAKGFFTSVWDGIKAAFSGGKGKIEGLSWSGIGDKIKTGIGNIASWFTGLFKSAKSGAEGLSWADVGTSILTGIQTILDAGGTFLSGAFTAAKAAIEAIPWSAIGEVIGEGVHSVIDVGGAFLTGGFEAAKAAVEGIAWGDIGTTIASAVNDTVDTAGLFLSGCFDAAKNAITAIDWTSIGTAISTAVNSSIDTAGAFLSGSFDAAKTAIEGIDWTNIGRTIANGVNGVVDTAGAFLSGSFEAAKTAIEGTDWTNIGTVIANGVNGAVDNAGAFLTGAFETGKTAIQAIDWGSVGTTIATAVNGSIDTAGAFLSGAFEAAKASIEAIDWAGLGGKVGELTTVATSIPLDALSGLFTTAEATINAIDWAGLGETVGGLLNSVTGISSDAISCVFTAAEATINSIDWNALGQTVADGLGRAGGLLAGIGDIGLGLGEAAVGAGQKGVNALKGWVSSWGNSSGTASEAQQVGQQLMTDVSAGVTAAQSTLVSTAGEAAQAFMDAFKEKLTGEATQAIITEFTSGFADIGTELVSAFQGVNVGSEIQGMMKGVTLEAEGLAVITTFSTGMTSGMGAAVESITATGEAIQAAAQAVNLSAQGRHMLQTLTQGMNSGRGAAVSSARATGNAIRSAFASINLYSTGVNIMRGLLNGMKSMFNTLLAEAKRMAAELKKTIQSGMEVKSPSRFTTWVGEMVGQGLVNGIEGMTAKVTAAAANMTSGMADALTPNLPTLPTIPLQYTIPTIEKPRMAPTVSPYTALAPDNSATERPESNSIRRGSFDININGAGNISIEGMTKKEIVEAAEKRIKPVLMNILEHEIFTGGVGTYEY